MQSFNSIYICNYLNILTLYALEQMITVKRNIIEQRKKFNKIITSNKHQKTSPLIFFYYIVIVLMEIKLMSNKSCVLDTIIPNENKGQT